MEKSLPHRNSNESPGDIIPTASSRALSSTPSFFLLLMINRDCNNTNNTKSEQHSLPVGKLQMENKSIST